MASLKPLPSQELLKELLDYDPETGRLTWKFRSQEFFKREQDWKRWNTCFAGKPAFIAVNTGYYQGSIFNTTFLAHRIIWKWMTGEDPVEVDHENRCSLDNRWDNLRDVTHMVNLKNSSKRKDNTSGITGVAWSKSNSQWQASICAEGNREFLGHYDTLEEASAKRKEAEIKYGFHENHGT